MVSDTAALEARWRPAGPLAGWSEVALSVDGQAVAFRSLGHGSHWVAPAQIGPSLVAIEARHLEVAGTGLVTIDDVDPYLTNNPPWPEPLPPADGRRSRTTEGSPTRGPDAPHRLRRASARLGTVEQLSPRR